MTSPEAKLLSAGIEHPALDHGIDRGKAAEYAAAVEHAMSMPEQEFLSFVPERPMVAYCECPSCYGGVEGNSIFTWSIDRPEEMVCRFCDTVFPNADYPEDREISGVNALGETITYRYHHNVEKDVPHFLSANLDRWRRTWLIDQCVALGRAYRATGDESFANRAIRVLDRIAELYPHYPVIQNGPRRIRFLDSQEPPYPWDSGKWGYFHDEIPRDLILTYDMVYSSPAFDSLSSDRGYDVRSRIENDWFRPTYGALTMQDRHVNNVIGYDVRSASLLGRVLNEPRYVHWAFGWMRECVESGFFVDGMWHESPAYHQMTVGGLESAFGSVVGYTDPPGYTDPVDGTRFDDLDPAKEIPFWSKCPDAPHAIDFPNGCTSTVHDTHPNQQLGEPRDSTSSSILPAYGHASLGRGSGENQMQAQLHFSGGYGHSHRDNLNLTLWARSREILPDLGYTWTQMRYWTSCTLGHNTVVVDRQDQDGTRSDGDLLWYFPDRDGVAVVEADGRRGYRGIESVSQYRRLIVLVPVDEKDAYVIDLFRVTGGSTHDWSLHGDADEDTDVACSLPLGEPRDTMLEPGEEWVEPTIEGAVFNPYGVLRDMRSASATDAFQVDFSYTDRQDEGVRVHLLGCDPGGIWVGNSPSVRRMGMGSAGDMRKAYDFWMPHLLVRRTGASPLSSTFLAIEEPYAGGPFLDQVSALPLEPSAGGALAIEIRHGKATDTIICTLDEAPYPERVTSSGVRLRGRLGLVRQEKDRVTGAWLFEGESLTGPGVDLSSPVSAYAGEITSATRVADGDGEDALVTSASSEMPTGDVLHGVWMIVTHGDGYRRGVEINRVEKQGEETVIVLADDHGLRIEDGTTREVYFPRREFQGSNTFVIPIAATLR